MRTARYLLAVVSVCLLAASGAQAATVSRTFSGVHVDETAGAEDNTISIAYGSGAWTVTETNSVAAPLVASTNCTGGGATVTCTEAVPSQVFVNDSGGTNTYTMTANLPSVMFGGDGADTLNGGPSTDQLNGADGIDHLNGGDGVNLLIGGHGADVFTGGTGAGHFTTVDYSDRTVAVTVVGSTASGNGGAIDDAGDDLSSPTIDEIDGTSGGDSISAGSSTSGPTFLRGHVGTDTLTAKPGGTTLIGGPGDDNLVGGSGFDIVAYDYFGSGTPGVVATLGGASPGGGLGAGDTDTYTGAIEEIDGSVRNDNLTGSSGNDYLKGQGGDDHLDGGAGSDHLYGDDDNPTFVPASDNDDMVGGTGSDRLVGNEGDDTLHLDDGEIDGPGGTPALPASDCDGPLPPSGTSGTNDAAITDSNDAPAANCEVGGGPIPTLTISAPVNNARTGAKPSFSGTAGDAGSDGSSIHLDIHFVNPDTSVEPDDRGFDVTRSGTNWAGQYPGNLSEGTWQVRAYQNTGQPNQGLSGAVRFVVDLTGPSPVITSPTEGQAVQENFPTITGNAGTAAGDVDSITLVVERATANGYELFTKPTVAVTNGHFAYSLGQGLNEGTYRVHAEQDDSVGNHGVGPTVTFFKGFPPSNTVAPQITGSAVVGGRLHVTTGTWSGAGPFSYGVVWLRCPDTTPEHCTAIDSAGGNVPGGDDYTVRTTDIGSRVFAQVIASGKAGFGVAYAATLTAIIADPNAGASGGANGAGAGSPSTVPPAIGHAVPQNSNACQTQLFFGPVGVTATCLKRVGLTWEATGKVDVNGIHLGADGGAKVVIDPLNLRIAAQGSVSVVAGPGTFGPATIGPFTLYKGSFEWVFRPDVSIPDFAGLATAIPGFGGGKLPSLGDLAGKPGLDGLKNLPRLPKTGLPDFSKISAAALSELRIPALESLSRMQIPAYYLPVVDLPAIGVDTGSASSLFGFPLEGSFAMRLANDGAVFDVGLALKSLGGLTAQAQFKLFNNGRFETREIKAHADEVNVAVLSLRPLDIHFDAGQNLWSGNAGAYLPFPGAPGIDAGATVQNGQLRRVALGYTGNLPLGPSGVFLKRLGLNLDTGPPRQLNAGVTLTAGPTVANVSALALDGKFDFVEGDPALLRFTGTTSLVNHPLADALIEYRTNGDLHAKGHVGLHLDSENKYGFDGTVEGWVNRAMFDIEGNVTFMAPGFTLAADGLFSSIGVAGCARFDGFWFNGLHVGAGYKWGAKSLDWLGGSCDFSAYRPSAAASAAQAGGAHSFTVPKGLAAESLGIHGRGAPPKVTLTGPGGATVTTPAGLNGLKDKRFAVVQDDLTDTTFIAVGRPGAGTWTITPQPGSVPITNVELSDPLPPPDVKARVSGSGRAQTLHWTLHPNSGQTVTFVERADKVTHVIKTTSSKAGKIRFTPADGPGGTRRIEAVVVQDGLTRETDRVATFKAPKPQRLAAPKGVTVSLKGTKLTVRWRKVAGADRYRVLATVNHGRKILTSTAAREHKATIDNVFSDAPVSVSVTAVDGANRDGKPGKAGHKPKRLKKTTIKGLKSK